MANVWRSMRGRDKWDLNTKAPPIDNGGCCLKRIYAYFLTINDHWSPMHEKNMSGFCEWMNGWVSEREEKNRCMKCLNSYFASKWCVEVLPYKQTINCLVNFCMYMTVVVILFTSAQSLLQNVRTGVNFNVWVCVCHYALLKSLSKCTRLEGLCTGNGTKKGTKEMPSTMDCRSLAAW